MGDRDSISVYQFVSPTCFASGSRAESRRQPKGKPRASQRESQKQTKGRRSESESESVRDSERERENQRLAGMVWRRLLSNACDCEQPMTLSLIPILQDDKFVHEKRELPDIDGVYNVFCYHVSNNRIFIDAEFSGIQFCFPEGSVNELGMLPLKLVVFIIPFYD